MDQRDLIDGLSYDEQRLQHAKEFFEKVAQREKRERDLGQLAAQAAAGTAGAVTAGPTMRAVSSELSKHRIRGHVKQTAKAMGAGKSATKELIRAALSNKQTQKKIKLKALETSRKHSLPGALGGALIGTVAAGEAYKHFKGKKKQASIVNETQRFVQQHSKEIAGALIGGAIAYGGQYAANKAGKNGSLSAQQMAARGTMKGLEAVEKNTRQAGKEPGFSHDVAKATSKAISDVADAMAKHPGKGALMALPFGLTAGMAIARKLG